MNTRLTTSLSGTNLSRAGDYNQRVVLQAIRVAGETTRTDLVAQTGLTQPTIANITRRLMDQGYLEDRGVTVGARGVRPQRLAIRPDSAFGIGVNVDRDHISVVALDLAGNVRSRATREIAFPLPEDVFDYVASRIDQMLAAGVVDASRLLGIGVAIPGGIASVPLPHRPAAFSVWEDVDIGALLTARFRWPIYVENDAAAAAIGEIHFGAGLAHANFFYILITAGLGGGLVIDGSYYRGASARAGYIGFLATDGEELQRTVSLSALALLFEQAGLAMPVPSLLNALSQEAAPIIDQWIGEAADRLVAPLSAVNCLIDPEIVLIGGRLPGELIDRLADAVNARMADREQGLTARAPVRRAVLAADAPAVGAAIMPFTDILLPSDAILMTAGQANRPA